MGDRMTAEQKVLNFAITRTKAWYDAAERAEIRNEPALRKLCGAQLPRRMGSRQFLLRRDHDRALQGPCVELG